MVAGRLLRRLGRVLLMLDRSLEQLDDIIDMHLLWLTTLYYS
jgi:hypothetical protein